METILPSNIQKHKRPLTTENCNRSAEYAWYFHNEATMFDLKRKLSSDTVRPNSSKRYLLVLMNFIGWKS